VPMRILLLVLEAQSGWGKTAKKREKRRFPVLPFYIFLITASRNAGKLARERGKEGGFLPKEGGKEEGVKWYSQAPTAFFRILNPGDPDGI